MRSVDGAGTRRERRKGLVLSEQMERSEAHILGADGGWVCGEEGDVLWWGGWR